MRLAVALLWYCHLQITTTFGFTVSYSKISFQFVELRQITFAGVKTKKGKWIKISQFFCDCRGKIYLFVELFIVRKSIFPINRIPNSRPS